MVLQQTTPQGRLNIASATIEQAVSVLIAIDIVKARHEVLVYVRGKKGWRRLPVLNKLDEFNRLIATFSEDDRPVRAAFEATGNCHRALTYRLGDTGFDVNLGSSVALARTREVLNNNWDKSHPKRCAGRPAFDADRERAILSRSAVVRHK